MWVHETGSYRPVEEVAAEGAARANTKQITDPDGEKPHTATKGLTP